MVRCPNCGRDNPPTFRRCYWCERDLSFEVQHWMEHADEPTPSPESVKKPAKPRKMMFGNLAALGYFLAFISPVAVSFVALPAVALQMVLLLGVAGVFMFSKLWNHISWPLEDERMKLLAFFSVGLALLGAIFLSYAAPLFAETELRKLDRLLAGWGVATYLIVAVVLIWLIKYFFKGSSESNTISLLLAVNIAGLVGLFFFDPFMWVFIGSLVALVLAQIILHANSLLNAGFKLENNFLKMAARAMYAVIPAFLVGVAALVLVAQPSQIVDKILFGGITVSRVSAAAGVFAFLSVAQIFISIAVVVLASTAFSSMIERSRPLLSKPIIIDGTPPITTSKGMVFYKREIAYMGGIIAAFMVIGFVGSSMYVQRIYGISSITGTGINATASGIILDKDSSAAADFSNGKATVNVEILLDKIDNVLNSGSPLKVRLQSPSESWSTGDMSIADSGKTEANYGENIVMDGVLDLRETTDNLYFKITIPTTAQGDVDIGTSILIELWPTTDDASAPDGGISEASFDENCPDDFWDEGGTISVYLLGANDFIDLSGQNAAGLVGLQVGNA